MAACQLLGRTTAAGILSLGGRFLPGRSLPALWGVSETLLPSEGILEVWATWPSEGA